MIAPPALDFDTDALARLLGAALPGLRVEATSEVDSTNTQLLARSRDARGAMAPTLLVAERQTAGRGRHGRSWASARGASLTFSLALRLTRHDWSGLSLAVGATLAEALESAASASPRLQLKWPNDLWLSDGGGAWRKLGGVLIESVMFAQRRFAVVGVGLNILPLPQPETALSHGYACLREIDAHGSAPRVLHTVALPLVRALLGFERGGFAPFATAYARRDLLRGRVVATTAGEVPQGVAEGVDSDGALLVRCGAALHRVRSGEVSVRPLDREAA